MDQIQLELVIAAQTDRLLAGLSSFEKALGNIEKAHGTAAAKADMHSAALDKFGSSLQRIAGYANLFAAFEAVKGALSVFDNLEQHNIDLLRTTEILGGNATAASTWAVVAHEMGINLDVIDRGFTKLSTDLNSTGNPALKQMGINAEDSSGKLRPLNDIVNQAANYFQAHAGAANNAALANQLFGRSGYELLPILEQGQAGLQKLTDEARKYGLILDSQTIERNAAFTFQLKESQLALDGLGMAVGNAVLPGLAALGQALSKVIEDNLPTFIGMINRAVSYLIGFVEGISGMKLTVDEGALSLSSLNNITGDTGSAMDKAAGSSQALADAIQKIRDRTKDTTDAIDDQIAALNAQAQARTFADQQAKLQEQIADKSKDIDRLRHKQYEEFWLGNYQTAADIGDQITQAQQAQADLAEQINTNTLNQQSKDQVSALQAQKQSIEDAANKQIAAMQRAAKGTTDLMSASAGAIPALFGKAGTSAGLMFAQDFNAEGIGQKMGQQLQDALFGPQVWVDSDRKIAGHFERKGGTDFQKVGVAIGNAIAQGVLATLGQSVNDSIRLTISSWIHNVGVLEGQIADRLEPISFLPGVSVGIGILRAESFVLRQFEKGGEVPGAEGQLQIIGAHGGEWVVNREQQRAIARGAGADMSTVEMLLRQVVSLLATSRSSGSQSAGVEAELFNAIDSVKRNRSRGIVGASY